MEALASAVPGVPALGAPAIGAPAIGAPVGASPLSTLQMLSNGIKVPYEGLVALTIIPPTGMIGLNHAAMNNQPVAFLKAASIPLCIMAITFLLPYYPAIPMLKQIVLALSYFGPWFMFDVMQILDRAKFKAHGFKFPLDIEVPVLLENKPTDGSWLLNTSLGAAIVAALSAYSAILINFLPSGLLSSDATKNIGYATGGLGAVFAVIAVGSMLTSKPAAPPAVMKGGGLPSLSSFADKLLKSKSPNESYAFLSILALVVLGGGVLAWSKQYGS